MRTEARPANGSEVERGGGGPDERVVRLAASAPEARGAHVRYYEAPGRSALEHWKLVAFVTLLAMALGAAFAVVRHPTYTADEQLYVGKTLSLDNNAAIAGLSTAADQIASDYSRLITTSDVTGAAAKALGNPASIGSLSATEIPQSPQITVTGTGASAQAALALTTAGSNALIGAVDKINAASSAQLKGLLTQYTQYSQQIAADNAQITTLQATLAGLQAAKASPAQLAPVTGQISTLQTEVSTLQLQASAVQTQYQAQYNPLQAEEQVIQSVGPAEPAGSDRKKALELAVFAALVVGLLVGVALASYLDLRSGRRIRHHTDQG